MNDWQSHPIEYKVPRTDADFPTLQTSMSNHKNRRGGRKAERGFQAQQRAVTTNLGAWRNAPHHSASAPEWNQTDVEESMQPNDEAFAAAAPAALPELKSVYPRYTDALTSVSRYRTRGYSDLCGVFKHQISLRVPDASAPYRSLVLAIPVRPSYTSGTGVEKLQETPKFKEVLPEDMLNREYLNLVDLRSLEIALGPRALEALRKAAPYKALRERQLPKFRSSESVRPASAQATKQPEIAPPPHHRQLQQQSSADTAHRRYDDEDARSTRSGRSTHSSSFLLQDAHRGTQQQHNAGRSNQLEIYNSRYKGRGGRGETPILSSDSRSDTRSAPRSEWNGYDSRSQYSDSRHDDERDRRSEYSSSRYEEGERSSRYSESRQPEEGAYNREQWERYDRDAERDQQRRSSSRDYDYDDRSERGGGGGWSERDDWRDGDRYEEDRYDNDYGSSRRETGYGRREYGVEEEEERGGRRRESDDDDYGYERGWEREERREDRHRDWDRSEQQELGGYRTPREAAPRGETREPAGPRIPPVFPILIGETRVSPKTPDWVRERHAEVTAMQRKPAAWKVRRSRAEPALVEEEVAKEALSRDDLRESEADQRDFFTCPRLTMEVRRAQRCLAGVLANSAAAFADDMHRTELSTWSQETDAAAVKARILEKYGLAEMEKREAERVIHIALPMTSITLAVGAGGLARIIFDDECTEVLVRGQRWDQIAARVKEAVTRHREIETVSVGRHSSIPLHEKHTLIEFATPADSYKFRERVRPEGMEAKRLPRELTAGRWDGRYAKRECMLDLDWDRHAVHGYQLRFHSEDQSSDAVSRVLRERGLHFDATFIRPSDDCSSNVYVAVPYCSPYPLADDIEFLQELMRANGIGMHPVEVMRIRRDAIQRIDNAQKRYNCVYAINRRMLKNAMDEGVWGGFHPRSNSEWDMMLADGRFTWDVEVQSDYESAKDNRNRATVTFDSFEQGERIATRAQRISPSLFGDDFFLLNKDDKRGVVCRARLRVHYFVPSLVAAFVHARLEAMDARWRANSVFSHADFRTEKAPFMQWCVLISDDETAATAVPPGYCRLIVEGFPRSTVEDGCAELMEVVRGDVMSCEGEDERWLLTGIGRNMADAVAKSALEEHNVLVDFNVLGREIRMVGERADTMKVEGQLREIATHRKAHIISTRITIGQPTYMDRLPTAIKYAGGLEKLQKVAGACKIEVCPEDVSTQTIAFEGTVAAYEKLRDALGEMDDELRKSAAAWYKRQRAFDASLADASLSPLTAALLCPVCCCRPATDFYRLEACGHVYCTQCICHQLSSQLSSRVLPLACLAAGCDRPLAVADLLQLLLGRDPERPDDACARLHHLDEPKLRPLVTAIVTDALQTKRDTVMACRTADCAGIFARGREEADGAGGGRVIFCKCCTKNLCSACGYEPHAGHSCADYEQLRENVDASLASYVRDKRVRKCPNAACSAVIEKTVGCNHMECTMCRTHFCWLCGVVSKTQGEIYAHMQSEHGGNGLHMDDGELFMLQFDD